MDRDSATPREDPHSLAPVQIEIATIDDDIARLKRGKSTRLMLTGLLSGLAVFGVVQWMQSIDGVQAYTAAAENLEAIHAQQGNAFLRCVLPDAQRSQLSSRQALHTALEVASERWQKYYGKQLQYCTGLSKRLMQRLNDLDVPPDAVRDLQGVRIAASELDRAVDSYRVYLLDPSRSYDFVQATPLIERVSIAWTAYEDERTRVNQLLRDR